LLPEKAVSILEDLIREAENISRAGRDSRERKVWVHTAEGALRAAFGSPDDNVRAFGGAQCGVYSPYDTEEYLEEQAQRQLSGMVSVLQSAVKQLRWHLPDPDQVFLPAGSQHDAYVEIRKIVERGTAEIFVVDPYVDDTLWPLLTNLAKTCKIRVLTGRLKGDFLLEGRKFCAQHGGSVEVRRTLNYHDRFIIVDGSECFHLGASIKDAGSKAFAISEMHRSQVAGAVIADAESEWLLATPVPL
jgi:hypothetical protein